MTGTIEEVWITKCNVTYSLPYLCADISQHDLYWYNEEAPMIDGSNGTVQASVFTTTSSFSIASQ